MDKSVHTKSWTSRLAGAAALAGLALAPGAPAWAQAGGGGTGGAGGTGIQPGSPGAVPQEEIARPEEQPVVPAQAPDVLLGDLGGLRSKLLSHGVDLKLDYTGEVAGNTSGQRTGTDYAQQIGFSADINWETLAGIPGFNTHFVVINRAGRNLSSDYIGDHIGQAQEIYGAGFNIGVHNVYAYAEQKLLDDRLNIAVGHWPLLTDFGTSTLACVAISLTPGCGNPRVLDNQTAGTNWPQSSWGGRVRFRITPDIYVQGGAWQVTPFPAGGRSGWAWFQGKNTGAAFPVELGWEPAFGPNRLTGHYKIGFLYDTSDYNDLLYSISGLPLPLSVTGVPQTHSGRSTVYGVLQQMLWRHGGGRDQGLTFLASAALGSTNTIFNDATAFASLIDTGIIPGRPNDTIQVAAGWFGVASRVAQLQSLQLQLNQPTFNGVIGPQRNEYVFEANYTAHVYRGVTLQPAIQYFVNPNAETAVKNAFVFAGRVHVNF